MKNIDSFCHKIAKKFHQCGIILEAMAEYLRIIDKYWLSLGAKW